MMEEDRIVGTGSSFQGFPVTKLEMTLLIIGTAALGFIAWVGLFW
jgi:hypothetical protein